MRGRGSAVGPPVGTHPCGGGTRRPSHPVRQPPMCHSEAVRSTETAGNDPASESQGIPGTDRTSRHSRDSTGRTATLPGNGCPVTTSSADPAPDQPHSPTPPPQSSPGDTSLPSGDHLWHQTTNKSRIGSYPSTNTDSLLTQYERDHRPRRPIKLGNCCGKAAEHRPPRAYSERRPPGQRRLCTSSPRRPRCPHDALRRSVHSPVFRDRRMVRVHRSPGPRDRGRMVWRGDRVHLRGPAFPRSSHEGGAG